MRLELLLKFDVFLKLDVWLDRGLVAYGTLGERLRLVGERIAAAPVWLIELL
jgi:hypothetical protein